MTDRKKSGVAFWATVVLVVALVAYPLSEGPVLWIWGHTPLSLEAFFVIDAVYEPLEWAIDKSPQPIKEWQHKYLALWGWRR